jgi:hypothetical protein
VLAHLHLCLAGCDSCVGRSEGTRVAFPVDDEQDVAFVDELVVLDPEVIDKAGNIRRDRHHVGLHAGIAGPWRQHVVVPELISAGAARGDED